MKTSRNSVMKGAVKRKPAAPGRPPPPRFVRPPGTGVTGEEMVAVASLMSEKWSEGAARRPAPSDDHWPATVRPCCLAYLTDASSHGCRAAVAPLPWSTDLPLIASPSVLTNSWIGSHSQPLSTAFDIWAYTLLTC